MKANRYYTSPNGFYRNRAYVLWQLAFVFFIGVLFLPTLSGRAQQIQTSPEGQPRIETILKLDRLDVMEIMGGSASQLPKWDLSYATGTYSQEFKEIKSMGQILDLGGLKLANGKEYPFLRVEGKAFVWLNEDDLKSKEKIEIITNKVDSAIELKENIWKSPDGKIIVYQVDALCLVLDPEAFPRICKVIGLGDSKTVYFYPRD